MIDPTEKVKNQSTTTSLHINQVFVAIIFFIFNLSHEYTAKH